ncbi:MAG: nitrogenase [Cyanosarcina radialis HA8281-LM2]|jgi:hypothetical protein|nr:nitrogenase [Cyanosarcina radialis HA8281-LM2]
MTYLIDIIITPLCQHLESVEINNYITARIVCQIIPASCPFKREIKLFDRTIVRIPALCQLNPFYEQIIGLRCKSLEYLTNKCSKPLTKYSK